MLEIMSSNVSTTYITCPADPQKTLGIKLPFLVMIVKVSRTTSHSSTCPCSSHTAFLDMRLIQQDATKVASCLTLNCAGLSFLCW